MGHIVADFLGYLPALTNGATFTTQGGTNITVKIIGGNYYINNAKIIDSNLLVDNGVCHVVDSVRSIPSRSPVLCFAIYGANIRVITQVIVPTVVPPVPFTGAASTSLKRSATMLAAWSFGVCLLTLLLI